MDDNVQAINQRMHMLAKSYGCAVVGIEGHKVDIEVHIVNGVPALNIVGLPDASVKEARERVRSSIVNSGFEFPKKRITVNLAPADLRKEGPGFDLAIALGMLAASGLVNQEKLQRYLAYGELSLDGRNRGVDGALLASELVAKHDLAGLMVANDNATEAALIDQVEVIGVADLRQAADFLNGTIELVPFTTENNRKQSRVYNIDFSEVRGQEHAKRALEVAAAGNHHCLMIGPPGSGKSMLAQRMPTILPGMSKTEALEVTKIHSIAGLKSSRHGLVYERPFRSPHHTVSYSGLVGGGANPKPGEITLSHNGILFLDELPEFHRHVIESLRQPLETAGITITRAASTVNYPCRFMLIAAMNPCPCGYFGDRVRACKCSLGDIYRYQKKISGPLIDRFDLRIEVPHLEKTQLFCEHDAETSKTIGERVIMARERQEKRYINQKKGLLNSTVSAKELRRLILVKPDANMFLEKLVDKLRLSGRAFDSLLRISATIADLDQHSSIEVRHIAEASQYRNDFWQEDLARR